MWVAEVCCCGRDATRSTSYPFNETAVDVAAEDRDAQLAALCRLLVGCLGGDAAWATVSLSEVRVVEVSGGITNRLFRLEPPPGVDGVTGAPVLARVFGKAGDAVCNRYLENLLVQELSHAGFGPRILGIFGNGRFEGWFVDRRPLEPLEMMQTQPVDFQALIARRLADMHEFTTGVAHPDVWTQLRDWVALGKSVSFPDDALKARKLSQLAPYPRFEEQLDELERILPSSKNDRGKALIAAAVNEHARRARELLYEERFCHLDLLSGNILFSKNLDDVEFIDFEYSGVAYVGLDIANHFNAVPESCLILDNTFDVDKYYPSPAQQKRWLLAYFAARGTPLQESSDGALFVSEMLVVIADFTLLAELRWVIWSVVQAGCSSVDFDYLDYGLMRFDQGYAKYAALRRR